VVTRSVRFLKPSVMYWYVGLRETPSFPLPPSPYVHDQVSITPPDVLFAMIELSAKVITSSIQLLGTSITAVGAELTNNTLVSVVVASKVLVNTYRIRYSPPGKSLVLIRKFDPSNTILGARTGSSVATKVLYSSPFDEGSFHAGIPTSRSRLPVPEFSQMTSLPNSSTSLGSATVKSMSVTGLMMVDCEAKFVQPFASVYV